MSKLKVVQTKKKWTMPAWMKPYEIHFCNTGGNTVEELMNRSPQEANIVINAPLALICMAVESQVCLLTRLKDGGRLQS